MRIRTTRQAREIRKGIILARDPRPITTEDIGGHLYQFPLTQRAYQRTRNRPPQGETGNQRQPHPGWLSVYDNGSAHVIPIRDHILHAEDPDCICMPRAELIQHNGDAWIYTHHSLDGREHTEPDRNKQ